MSPLFPRGDPAAILANVGQPPPFVAFVEITTIGLSRSALRTRQATEWCLLRSFEFESERATAPSLLGVR